MVGRSGVRSSTDPTRITPYTPPNSEALPEFPTSRVILSDTLQSREDSTLAPRKPLHAATARSTTARAPVVEGDHRGSDIVVERAGGSTITL